MNEMERWAAAGSSIIPSREAREHKKAIERLVNETKFAGLRLDAEAALTGRIMERAVDLDHHRKALAGDDPALNAVLMRIELGFADKGIRIQKSLGSEFPL